MKFFWKSKFFKISYITNKRYKIFKTKKYENNNLVKFLISDEASFINNQVIKIDGGIYGDC